jgi:hypothetical protein
MPQDRPDQNRNPSQQGMGGQGGQQRPGQGQQGFQKPGQGQQQQGQKGQQQQTGQKQQTGSPGRAEDKDKDKSKMNEDIDDESDLSNPTMRSPGQSGQRTGGDISDEGESGHGRGT